MKRIISFFTVFSLLTLSLIIAGCGGDNATAATKTEGQQLVKLADNIYAYIDATDTSSTNSMGANAGVIIGDDGIAVIDSRVSAAGAQKFIKDIRAISNKPIKYVINTHRHLDHAFGNCEFAKMGATIIMSKIDSDDMKLFSMESEYAKFGVPASEYVGTTVAYPDQTFSDTMEIDLGNQTIQLIYPGKGHTAGSIFVYLPTQKMLFTGDNLIGSTPFMGDSNPAEWIKTLNYVLTMDVESIVPGHGPLFPKTEAATMRDYIALFDTTAKALCTTSSDLDYITAEMKKVLPVRGADFLIAMNISALYLK